MTMQNAERMLTDQPVPPPPVGLIEDLKAEIPDNIEIHPSLSETTRVAPWHKSRNLRLAVAAVFVVALTAVVSWQVRRPSEIVLTIPDPPPVVSEPTLREVPEVATRSPVQEAAIGEDLRVPVALDAAPADSKESRNEEAVATEVTKRRNDEIYMQIPTESQPAGVGGEVTDEMIEQAMERSFEGEVTVTGSLIPRADLTAVSPVVAVDAPAGGVETRVESNPKEISLIGSRSARIESGRAPQAAFDSRAPAPSTGGTAEPNDQPYGDVFFEEAGVNPFIDTEDDHFSTFGLEVDTGSYNVVRRYLSDGHLPPREAVRAEEILNAFAYGDVPPSEGDFALSAEGAPSPFAEGSRYKIVRFGVTARAVDAADRPPAILTFVVDVSGSMDRENRLVLVKRALNALLDNLREDDRVGLVIYGSRGEVLLEPTTDHEQIGRAIDQLRASGSTNAEEGLVLAYQLADRYRNGDFINRVILCSDGVANVGRTGPDSILERIKAFADNGIELTTVGFGMGNYNDVLMEQLADTGDGRYAYVDTFDEAQRLFVEELTGTLLTIGSEAKAQVEFNPAVVSRYRLVGYENRDIADERFRDPTVDAGEIGAGLTATAVYEIKLHKGVGRWSKAGLATLRVRYRPFKVEEPVEIEQTLKVRDLEKKWKNASSSLRLATLVAEYAEILKQSYWARTGDMDIVLSRARELAPEFEGDKRVADWIGLVEAAAELIREADDESIEITD